MELEQVADPAVTQAYACGVQGDAIDGVQLVAALAEDLARGRLVPHAAAMFHNGLADAMARACAAAREATGLSSVALSGGSFQNMLLLRGLSSRLSDGGFNVLVHHRVPPNDGGISLGQVVIANALSARD
jgi:hydrogenase maturation protein HypF